MMANKEKIARIKQLKIPPNWTNVCVSDDPTDYLQVTGMDVGGKIQYIYHPLFVLLSTVDKFERLKLFCRNMPLIEKQIHKDLRHTDKKIALIALLFLILKKTNIRIGNECYARDNKTFGLTTLQKKHIKVEGTIVTLNFIGKTGVRQNVKFTDAFIAESLKKLLKNPSSGPVFVYGKGDPVKAIEMNEYLKVITGENFTCKDFRTYAGNLSFIKKLCKTKITLPQSLTSLKKIVNTTYKEVAEELGHTVAISKKAYILPSIAEKFIEDPKAFSRISDYRLFLNKFL